MPHPQALKKRETLDIYIDNGELYVGGWNVTASQSGWSGTFLNTNIVAGEWYDVSLVLDGNGSIQDDAFKGYLDGVEFGSGVGSQLWAHGNSSGIGSVSSTTKLHTGNTREVEAFGGMVDNLRVYDRALNATEIAAQSNSDMAMTQIVTLDAGEHNPTLDAGLVQLTPGIDIEKFVNGIDVTDLNVLPEIVVGADVTFTYEVMNTGNIDFSQTEVLVKDDNGTPGNLDDDFVPTLVATSDAGSDGILSAGETWLYTSPTTAALDLSSAIIKNANFSFTGSSSTSGSNGNIRTFSDNGVTVDVSAHSRSASGDWNTGYVGVYGSGLGVTNSGESGASHRVDNGTQVDYLLFEFDKDVTVNETFLNSVVNDSDISIWIGDRDGTDISSLNDSLLQSFSKENNFTSSSGSRLADINDSGLTGDTLIISAYTGGANDQFKLNKLNTSVPEIVGNGEYLFDDLSPGDYQIDIRESTLPEGFKFTTPNQGTNDSSDSDVQNTSSIPLSWGVMANTTLDAGENDHSWDAGIVAPSKASIGDRVWEDMNHNGIQDVGEPGIGGIAATLYAWNGRNQYVAAQTTTDSNGNYLFTNLGEGYYYVKFDKAGVRHDSGWGGNFNMSDWYWSTKNVGSNDAIDSDVYKASGDMTNTNWTYLDPTENDLSWDAGITPIVIDLNGDGIQTVSRADAQGSFDLFGNGTEVESGWISSDDGFLAIDSNGNGTIDDISELFGGVNQGDGFAKLASFDSNGDGIVNAADDDFASLLIWQDANGNHNTDSGELMSLVEAGIESLAVEFTELPFVDAQGNLHLERSSATLTNGKDVDLTDIYFNVALADAYAAGLDSPSLAELSGYDQVVPEVIVDNISPIINDILWVA